jgi:adenylate cyclase class 2
VARLEVEVKVPVDCSELRALKEKLERLGARIEGPIREEDIYLNHPCRDVVATDEAIRVRFSPEGVKVAYKGPRRGGTNVKARFEIEEKAGPGILEFLKALGFTEALRVVKERVYASLPDALVTLDKVEGLGCFVEVESRHGLEEEVERVIKILGLEDRPLLVESYASMLASRKLPLGDSEGS